MIRQPPREDEATSWLWVGLWVLSIYVTVPLARMIQSWIQEHADRSIFTWVVLVSVVIGLVAAVRALRAITVPWHAWMVLVAVAATYSYFTWQLRAHPEEAFHFVQYGVLGLLVFRALTHRVRDPSIFVTAALLTSLFGMLDEGFQWVVPRRYFDFRDIGINMGAGVLMQIAIAFGLRPAYLERRFSPRAWQLSCRAGLAVAAVMLFYVSNTAWTHLKIRQTTGLFAGFGEVMVEYGHRFERPDLGLTFFSRLTLEEILTQDRERWQEVVPILDEYWPEDQYVPFLRRFPSYEDPFLYELRIHQFRRDRYRLRAFSAPRESERRRENATISLREDQIMRLLYPTIYTNAMLGWPDSVLEHVTSLADLSEPYTSAVSQDMITGVSRWTLRGSLAGVMILLMVADRRLSRCPRNSSKTTTV
jgi:VanZ family protein